MKLARAATAALRAHTPAALEARRAAAAVQALHDLVPVVTAYVREATVPATPISVVIATRNRYPLLREAIASVERQSHPDVQLVVVDDGSSDETAALTGPWTLVRTAGVGLAAARNAGLAAATGDVVTYLDDDNVMHGDWLRGVAWAFSHFDAEVIYGGRIYEDVAHRNHLIADPPVEALYPQLQLYPFDRAHLEQVNIIDANVIAHRRDHPEARFDETTSTASDWDLALRLTRDRPAVAVPLIACNYRTREPTRMSRDLTASAADEARVRTLHRA